MQAYLTAKSTLEAGQFCRMIAWRLSTFAPLLCFAEAFLVGFGYGGLVNAELRRLVWRALSESFITKLEDRLGVHQKPLKERLALVTYRLRVQRNKIESMSLMMQRRDRELFDKCVAARSAGDPMRANFVRGGVCGGSKDCEDCFAVGVGLRAGVVQDGDG